MIRPVTTPSRHRSMKLPVEESELIFCDVQDIVRHLRKSNDYFPAHAAILDFTSSIGMPSPRSSDASPSSTACRNSSS